MLDGFEYVLAQIGAVVVITALLAGVSGWLLGRGSRRRTEKAFEKAIAAISDPETVGSPFAPPMTDPHAETEGEEPSAEVVVDPDPADDEVEPLAQRQPYGVTLIEYVPLHEIPDPDATVIRPPSTPRTTPYVPPAAVITSAPGAPVVAPYQPRRSAPPATSEDVQQLRQELRTRDLEIGRIEAGALTAWDRTVPQLEQQIDDLLAENDGLQRRIREAEEHSTVDAATVDHLRALVADRDTKIAELRAQV